MFEDKTIACTGCGTEFVFTAAEQEFFNSKGFTEPRRCKPCRDAAKAEKRGGGGGYGGSRGGGYGGGGGGYDRPPREMFDAVCSGCGCQTQVPFQPDGRKPVYCRECFRANAPARSY